jgi:hypothetical protein
MNGKKGTFYATKQSRGQVSNLSITILLIAHFLDIISKSLIIFT